MLRKKIITRTADDQLKNAVVQANVRARYNDKRAKKVSVIWIHIRQSEQRKRGQTSGRRQLTHCGEIHLHLKSLI